MSPAHRTLADQQAGGTIGEQAERARGLLARLDPTGTGMTDREQVLAGEVRVLLELVTTMATQQPLLASEIEDLAGQLAGSARALREATARLQAGTAALRVLAALAQSWDDEAGRCGSSPAAQALRECAAQLRATVRHAYTPARPLRARRARGSSGGTKKLTRCQAGVLRALSHGAHSSARELGVRSDVLWRLEERGLVTRNLHQQWRITAAGTSELDQYTAAQADKMITAASGRKVASDGTP